MPRRAVVLLVVTCLLSACDGQSPDAANEPMTSTTIDVVCNEDGTTELHNFDVVTSEDGVHFQVDNRAGESVSLNGSGRDFRAGVTEQVALIPPGDYEIACWPVSMHNGKEPSTQTIQVTDPEGLWVPPGLACPEGTRQTGAGTLDYGLGSPGRKGDPVDLARRVMEGLEEDDEIITVGYPEAEFREVALMRHGKQVANLSYSPSEDGGWLLGGYSACDPKLIDISGGP